MSNGEASVTDREHLMALATEIVSAHVSNNNVTAEQLQTLIQEVFGALANAKQKVTAALRPEPAISIKESVKANHLTCLECGRHFSMLRRHLRTDHEMTPGDYRRRWVLPLSYPMVAPAYSKVRSGLAKKSGLGRRGRPAPKKAGLRRRRT
jgi:predicted transcriptional regulator